jgi:hypothetical protein
MNKMLSDRMLRTLLEEFDLQEDEVFKITGFDDYYMINKRGLVVGGIKIWSDSMCLNDLLNGSKKVVKLPFIPKKHEEYYSPDILAESLYKISVNHHVEFDIYRIDPKLCFRTKEEAIRRAREILRLIEEENNAE